jgi:uncharacterized membrane protein
MNNSTAGYVVFAAAVGMMFGLLSVDVSRLHSWAEISTPGFVASILGHLGVVLTAFVGGKLVPENRQGKATRATDTDRTDSGPKPDGKAA